MKNQEFNPLKPMIQPTSRDAYKDIREDRELTQTEKVLHIIRKSGGSTINQVKRIMGLESGIASARIRKLVQDGSLFNSGRKHKDETTGKVNIIWETKYGFQPLLF